MLRTIRSALSSFCTGRTGNKAACISGNAQPRRLPSSILPGQAHDVEWRQRLIEIPRPAVLKPDRALNSLDLSGLILSFPVAIYVVDRETEYCTRCYAQEEN